MAYSLLNLSFSLLVYVSFSSLLFFTCVSAAPKSLRLKRSFPNHGMELSQLRGMDMQRHGRLLQSSVVSLPVHGATQLGHSVKQCSSPCCCINGHLNFCIPHSTLHISSQTQKKDFKEVMAYLHVNPSFSLILSRPMLAVFLSFMVFLMLVSPAPTSLVLKRSFPNHGIKLSQLREMDMRRHGRMQQSSVVNLPLNGTIMNGFYYTTVHLGSPSREFHVLIDTGSDISWVNCVSCNGCPHTSNIKIKLNYFDPTSSSTSSFIPCSHHKCATCSANNNCSFDIQYIDGSGTSGYFVSDLMHISNISKGPMAPNSSGRLVFGCSNLRTGRLTLNESMFDGVFGFGKQDMSLISQLYSQGIAPRVFSHCLKGDISGGGILVLGEVVEPNMSYTPLIPKQPHYNIYLESISVNGHILKIDPTVFTTSSNKGVVIDSGTTMAYFIEGAYNPIVDAITRTIPQSVGTTDSDGFYCYLVTTSALSIYDIFPPISLNFANHASLVLSPQDYLILSATLDGGKWCLAFQKSQEVTILGDILLKDKNFVYDLDSQRIGWTNYNCSLPVNISTPSTRKNRSGKGGRPQKLIMTMVLTFMIYMTLIFI